MKDYYKILNVKRSDNAITIKKAFRKQALILHPDVNKSTDAHEKFLDLNEAYQVLNDLNKRGQYNRLYDFKILNRQPKNQTTYNKRYRTWESNVKNAAKKGQSKGEKYASENEETFSKRAQRWANTIVLEIIFRILLGIVEAIISIF